MLYTVRASRRRPPRHARRGRRDGLRGRRALRPARPRAGAGARLAGRRLGLVARGRHVPLAALEGELPELAAQAAILGSEARRAQLDRATGLEGRRHGRSPRASPGRRPRRPRSGLELGFHNHDGEVRPLEGGPSFLDDLARAAALPRARSRLGVVGRRRPCSHSSRRTRGRVPLVHVKDFRPRGERSYCPVGDGAVGYEQRGAGWRSLQVWSGCWSSRTRRRARRSPPRSDRSRRCARCWRSHEDSAPGRCRRLRGDQPPLRPERCRVRRVRAGCLRRSRHERRGAACRRPAARPPDRRRSCSRIRTSTSCST